MNEQRHIDADQLDAAMQRADREQDDDGLHELQRQVDALQRDATSQTPARWALRERAHRAWGDDDPDA